MSHLRKKRFMYEVFMALMAGLIVGFVFSLIKLPLPAPPMLAGIAGIFGIYLGGQLFGWITRTWFN